MKKLYTLIILSILIIPSFAQDSTGFSISFQMGISFSNFVNRDPAFRNLYKPQQYIVHSVNIGTSYIDDAQTEPILGLDAEYHINAQQSVVLGFYLEAKGYNQHLDSCWTTAFGSFNELEFQRKINNDYLVIPLVYRRYFLKNRKLFLEAGFYGGIWLKSFIFEAEYLSILYEGESQPWKSYMYCFHEGIENHTTSFDYGLVLGAGYKYMLTNQLGINARLRYSYGLVKIDALNESTWEKIMPNFPSVYNLKNYYGISSDARNTSLSITIGISYKI